MKILKILIINLIILVGSVEVISFIFFKERLRIIFAEYWQDSTSFGRGYPRNHFTKHPERGFDIDYNSKPVIATKPDEIKPYPVWGNHIGCFDENIKNQSKYVIYLAGDSFTWGYAPYEKKFGTKLENELGVDVAACGVTHTGQRHQFQKFKEVSQKLGYFPETVFVNVVFNDIDNDLSHPHTTVIEGYQVNNVKVNINKINKSFHITKIDNHFLNSRLSKSIRRGTYARFGHLDPRKYLATSVLLYAGIYKPFLSEAFSSQSASQKSNSIRVYGFAKSIAEESDIGYPINSFIAKNNRKVIKEWIQHAEDNKYDLIFADINTQLFNYKSVYKGVVRLRNIKERQFFCEFIKKQGSTCFSFVNYLDGIGIKKWQDVRWKGDGHFNLMGNQLYADFLSKIYKQIY